MSKFVSYILCILFIASCSQNKPLETKLKDTKATRISDKELNAEKLNKDKTSKIAKLWAKIFTESHVRSPYLPAFHDSTYKSGNIDFNSDLKEVEALAKKRQLTLEKSWKELKKSTDPRYTILRYIFEQKKLTYIEERLSEFSEELQYEVGRLLISECHFDKGLGMLIDLHAQLDKKDLLKAKVYKYLTEYSNTEYEHFMNYTQLRDSTKLQKFNIDNQPEGQEEKEVEIDEPVELESYNILTEEPLSDEGVTSSSGNTRITNLSKFVGHYGAYFLEKDAGKYWNSEKNNDVSFKSKFRGDVQLSLYKIERTETFKTLRPSDLKSLELYSSWQQENKTSSNNNAEGFSTLPIKFPKLHEGKYLLTARVKFCPYVLLKKIIVSDHVLYSRKNEKSIDTITLNRLTLKPVKGKKLEINSSQGRLQTRITSSSNKDGIFSIDDQLKTNSIQISSTTSPLLLNSTNNIAIAKQSNILQVWTSAPQYKPGETIHFRGNIRQKGALFSLPLETKYTRVEILDPSQKRIFSKDLKLSSTGAFFDKCKLKAVSKTGKYTFKVNNTKCSSVVVKAYKLPRFRLDIQNKSKFCKIGSEYRNSIKLFHMNGTPLAGEPVTVKFQKPNSTPYRIKLTTDSSGSASFRLPAGTLQKHCSYAVTFEYISPDGQSIKESITLLYSDGSLYIHVNKQHYKSLSIYRASLSSSLDYLTPDKIEFTLLDAKKRVLKKVTSTDGELLVYNNSKTKSILCTATYKNQIKRHSFEHNPKLKKSDKLLSITCPPTVHNGDSFNLQVDWNPVKARTINAFIFGENIKTHFRKFISLKPGQNFIPVSVLKKWGPNIFFHVVVFDPEKEEPILDESCTVQIKRDDSFQINVSTDKSTYEPGDLCKVNISCLNKSGKPIPGVELSLAVLNESLYKSVRPVSILKTFNEYKLSNNFDTSFGSRHYFYKTFKWQLGVAQSINSVLLNGHTGITGAYKSVCYFCGSPFGGTHYKRSRFNEIALWEPLLKTDKEGKVTLSFKMSDTVSNWIFDIKAISLDGQAAEKTYEVNSSMSIETDIIIPRIIRAGDKVGLPLQVINRTKNTRATLNAQILHEGKSISRINNAKINLKENSLHGQFINVKVPFLGPLELNSSASTNMAKDSIKRKLEITPIGYKHKYSQYIGSLRPEKIKLPSLETYPDSMHVNIQLETDLSSKIRSALKRLKNYRYGCAEQTISRFTPLIVVNHSLEKIGIDSPYKNEMPEIIDKGLARLYRFQHSDGGWQWYETGNSSYRISTLVLEGLLEAYSQGVEVDLTVIERGAHYVLSLFKTKSTSDSNSVIGSGDNVSYLASVVLSRYAKLFNNDTFLSSVEKSLPILLQNIKTSQETIYLCKTYLNCNKKEEAIKLFKLSKPWRKSIQSRSSVMLTGTALEIVKLIDPEFRPLKTISLLSASRKDGWWYDTRATHLAIRGLAAHIKSQAEKAVIGVFLNGKKLGELSDRQLKFDIKGKQLLGARLLFQNMNGTQYNAVVSISSFRRKKVIIKNPDAKLSYKLKSLKNGSSLNKAIFKLHKFYTYELNIDSKFKLSYSRVSIPRPAGIELIGNPKLPQGVVSFEEYDDSFNFFIEDLPAGKHTLKLHFKADLPGEVFAPLPELDSMYGKGLRVNSYGPEKWIIKQ